MTDDRNAFPEPPEPNTGAPEMTTYETPTEPDPTISIETTTPELAEKYRANQLNPRKPTPSVVARYAADMAAGNWSVGLGVIGFDADGRLRNGNHRMLACIEADTPFRSIVSRGVSELEVDNADQGSKRTLAQVLDAHGAADAGLVALTINAVRNWEDGKPGLAGGMVSVSTARQFLDEHPTIITAVTLTAEFKATADGIKVLIRALAPFTYRALLVDEDRARAFLADLGRLTGHVEGEPTTALRRTLAKLNSKRHYSSSAHANSKSELAMLVKAWNLTVKGKTAHHIAFGAKEKFPVMLGANGKRFDFGEGERG